MGLTRKTAVPSDVSYEGPFSDSYRHARPVRPAGVGIAVSTYEVCRPRTPSPTPSTPSIYPPTLPAVPEHSEDALFYEKEMVRPRPTLSVSVPPYKVGRADQQIQNPFASPLDKAYEAEGLSRPRKSTVGQANKPLTPPDSTTEHSHTSSSTSAQSSDSEVDAKTNPFSNAFLGRSVSHRGPLRPMRSPLRPALLNRPDAY